MRLIWAESAIADLLRIRNYIVEYNPQAADTLSRHLLQAAERLRAHPMLGLKTRRPDIRRLVVPQSAYCLIYRTAAEDIEILEVFDGRQRKPRTSFAR